MPEKQRIRKKHFSMLFYLLTMYILRLLYTFIQLFLWSVNAGLPNRVVSTLRHTDQMTKPKPTTSTASHPTHLQELEQSNCDNLRNPKIRVLLIDRSGRQGKTQHRSNALLTTSLNNQQSHKNSTKCRDSQDNKIAL